MDGVGLDELREIGKALSREHGKAPPSSLEVDMDYYKTLLDAPELSDADKEQMITALWSIIVAFVELGFGVHPVQQACGQERTNQDQTPNSNQNRVDCSCFDETDKQSSAPEP